MIGSAGWRFSQTRGEFRGCRAFIVPISLSRYETDVDEPPTSVLPPDRMSAKETKGAGGGAGTSGRVGPQQADISRHVADERPALAPAGLPS